MAFWVAFLKGRRRAHQRQYESGKTGWVRETQTKRTKKAKAPGGQGALFGEKGQPTKAARQAAQSAPAAKQPMSKKQGKPKTIPVSERSGASEIRVTDKGNKQYLYDKEHEQESHEKKLARMKSLGTHLPEIVDWCSDRLDLPGAPKEKVIAALVALMDRCYFRIGLARYVEENQTYGVSTLRPDHVTVNGDEIAFSFVGKKQVQWDRTVTDPRLARFVGELQAGAPGDSLFWYEEGGERKPITADDVNEYLKQYGVTAKDIRTYHATRLAFDALKKGGRQPDDEPLKGRALGRALNQAIASVADALGHEVSVCKTSYILPQLTRNFTENGGMFVVGGEPFVEHLQAMEPVQLSVRAAAVAKDPARGKLAIGPEEQEFLRFLAAIGGSPVKKSLIAVVFGNTVALMKGRVRGYQRRLKSGKVITVPEYNRKGRAQATQPAGDQNYGPLVEPTPDASPARKLIDGGMRRGAKARAIAEKYFMDKDEFLQLWSGQAHPAYETYGHWQNPVSGEKVYSELIAAVGDFMAGPWNSNDFEQAFWAAFHGVEKLPYVRGWRYGELNERGNSQNYRDDVPEAGISMMAVTERADGGPLPDGPGDEVSTMFVAASGAKPIVVEGWLIPRRGSDGEPLLIGARKVGAA